MTTKKLPEGTWRVVAYLFDGDWVAATPDPSPEMTVKDGAFYGTSGLNRFKSGTSDLPSGPIATTMMAGPPFLMDQEQRLLAQIQRADEVVVGMNGMFLLHEGLAVVELNRVGTEASIGDV